MKKILNFSAQIDHALASDCVGIWDLDEPAGTAPTDRCSPSGANTTVIGNPPSVAGVDGKQARFFDSNNYLTLGSNPKQAPDKLTVQFFAKAAGPLQRYATVIAKTDGVNWASGWGFYYDTFDTPTSMCFFVTDYYKRVCWHVPDVNAWHHVAGTWDGATIRLYINGVLVGSHSNTFDNTNKQDMLTVGMPNSSQPQYAFSGTVDNIRIYSNSLP